MLRIYKSDYIPIENDIKMINQYYTENVRVEENKQLFEFYNCELNPSKWSQIYEINCVIFMVDFTAYHRTIMNPKTNNQINEMQYNLNLFTNFCEQFCVIYHSTHIQICTLFFAFVMVLFCIFSTFDLCLCLRLGQTKKTKT